MVASNRGHTIPAQHPGHQIVLIALVLAWVGLASCRSDAPPAYSTVMSGTLTVRANVDSALDFSGFEVVVLSNREDDLDTLAVAVTDTAGRFQTTVRVPERGIYPLVISRAGVQLQLEEVVLAAGDSIRIRAEFPLDGRQVRVTSQENGAWAAFRNARALHNRTVLDLVESGRNTESAMRDLIIQVSNVLWSLRDLYPGTLGATVAETEAVVMLEGWNDSLVVARYGELGPSHPGIVTLARAVRRSLARLDGSEAAVGFLESVVDSVSAEDAWPIRSELVVHYMDSLDRMPALERARSLLRDARGTDWAIWAGRAVYELENLMPGMPAPPFELLDVRGRTVRLEDLRGRTVMLEFFSPTDETFLLEIRERGEILSALRGRAFQPIAVSVEPDSALNEALLDGRRLLGTFVFDPDGLEGELARAYNVNVIPTRVLIAPDGTLLSRYSGPAIGALRDDLSAIFDAAIGVRPPRR